MTRIRRRVEGRQQGQVLPLFAIMALVIVGVVAMAVDYGFLTDQHRNLQAFADHAAIAGAQSLTPAGSSKPAARQAALEYIRDNLGGSFSTNGGGAVCGGGPYTADIQNCTLPSPFGNYIVSIMTPGYYTQDPAYNTAQTISVEIKDSVTNAMAAVLGVNTSQVGAIAQAKSQPPSPTNQLATPALPAALSTDGCINATVVSVPVIVDGDVNVNQCTVKFAGTGGFCAVSTTSTNGNIVIGPQGFLPGSILQGQNLANCQAQLAGVVISMGRIRQVASAIPLPALPGPPGTPSAGAANQTCVNGTVGSSGSPRSDCYNPGIYTVGGTNPLIVKNNLNPGVYYIDVSSGPCYTDTSVTSCGGVFFEGNTMNANLNGVVDKCWAAPNVPSANTFTTPCPDGLITDPTVPTDPECLGGPIVGAVTPTLWTAAGATAGGGGVPAGTYYVRLTARSSIGESLASTASTVVTTALNNAIHISIPTASVGETGGYDVYIGTTSGQERYVANIPHNILGLGITYDVLSVAGGTRHTPLFDNSQCLTGFHNIPHSKDTNQNFGVTFVLTGKAGFCMGVPLAAGSDNHCVPYASPISVLMQPYCASGFTPNPESQTCTNRSTEDGAYAVYGASEGAIRTSGTLGVMNLSGTVYLPRGTLQEDIGSRFILSPGQMAVHDATISITGSLLTPLVYYGSNGAVVPSTGSTQPTVGLSQ